MMVEELTNHERAEVLFQALPYIKKYTGKIVVIKYGGNAMISEKLKQQVMGDIVMLQLIGVKVVLVHGGGPEISQLMQELGREPQFIDGVRVTDKDTMELVQMVLAGKISKTLVNLLEVKGGSAMGISGMDGHLLEARCKDERLGYVGEIVSVNPAPILDLLEGGYIPVVSTVGCDRKGNTYNVNADTAASAIAGALKAKRLIMMTDIDGIMRDQDDPESLIPEITVSEARALIDQGVVAGGMIPKVECCINAVESGVDKVVIIDGRVSHAVLMEMLTNEGAGTMIVSD